MSILTRETIGSLKSPLARVVEVHGELSSTQERARELARDPQTPHGTLVVAGVQTGGRGRLGRHWGSPAGGLWMSLVLRPDFDASIAPRVTQTAAVGVAKALWNFEVEARIKWPNDLLVAGRKVCGILAESGATYAAGARHGPERAGRLDYVVLGVGMNANLDLADLAVPDREVTTVRSELGHDVDLLELLRAVLSNLGAELRRIEDFGAVLVDWRALNCTLGESVRVRRFGEILEGRAVDLNPEGALLLETPRGTIELFEGEIEHLRHGAAGLI